MRYPADSLRRVLVVLSCVYTVSLNAAADEDTATTWQRWERALESDCEYENACTDVEIRIRFDGPDGRAIEGLGTWDGGKRFLIRCAFPVPGLWHWRTDCSDRTNRGLHDRAGSVDVSYSPGANALTRHGYLRVSDNGRLLTQADGSPFLWIGDTCWAAPVHATSREWRRYVADRAEKGYTVLQLAIAPRWALERARGVVPFLSKLPDIRMPNPEFFQELDRKLAVANDHGLAIMMCGLMETPYEYPPPEQIEGFSRYVAARYSSFAVMFSPSFDSGLQETEMLASASAIWKAAPSSLITMHMGTGIGPSFHGTDWLAFNMYQSGHNGGDRARQSMRAIEMPAKILGLTPRKPAINGEAIYEGGLGGAYDVRRTAWLSFLSGAAGYTTGIDAVYAWEDDAIAQSNVPSIDQVALLGQLLRALPWWDLSPASERILNQSEDRAKLMAFALTEDERIGVAYLPENAEVKIDLRGGASEYDTLWIEPSTGQTRRGPSVDAGPEVVLPAPDGRDWALLLTALDSPLLARVARVLTDTAFKRKGSSASIDFTEDAPVDGLVRRTPRDGAFTYASHDGVQCIVNKNPVRNRYLYIDIDDRLVFRGAPKAMRLEVRLHSDSPIENIQLQYDSQGPADVESVYRSVSPSDSKQVNGWTVLKFNADAPYCGNRQNSGADFRLYFAGYQCHVASLRMTFAE